jgi:hypothetical protein
VESETLSDHAICDTDIPSFRLNLLGPHYPCFGFVQLGRDLIELKFLLMCSAVLEDSIHVLEALALRFWNTEPDEQGSEQAEGCEEYVCAPSQCREHHRGHKADDKISKPRCAGRN